MKSCISDKQKSTIKDICVRISYPALFFAFDTPINQTINKEVIVDFKQNLLDSLLNNSRGQKTPLPHKTNRKNLPLFIAIDKPEGGALALYNLGYRPSSEAPIPHCSEYKVEFFTPDGSPVSFFTGPNGGFSIYALWSEMHYIYAKQNDNQFLVDRTYLKEYYHHDVKLCNDTLWLNHFDDEF